MCIQTPGAFVFAASLAARVGWEGWSTWFVYVVTGVLQGCVLALGIYYELKNRRSRKGGPDETAITEENTRSEEQDHTLREDTPATEATPLLPNK